MKKNNIETNENHNDYKPQFTKTQFIKFIHVLFSGSVILSNDVIKHYYNKVRKAGYIKKD